MKVEDIERKGRLLYLDNLGGILILYMIFLFHLPGHCGIGSSTSIIICRNFFDFFMAWFFFKGGMTYKRRSIQEEMSKSFKRLLVPYITINAICLILWTCTHFSKVGISGILTLLCDSFYLECVTLCYVSGQFLDLEKSVIT